MNSVIITLDGPAGSGKSTLAQRLAQRLGLAFLDTGAMYRGLTAVALDLRVDPKAEPEKVAKLASKIDMRFNWATDPPRLLVGGADLTGRLRDADVTSRVSYTAAIPAVREVMVRLQQAIGQAHPRLVTEGRDQGSVVFPDAAAKFYLDASPQVRARRRTEQLRAIGKVVSEAEILAQIQDRDRLDSTRAQSPLICPHDALRIDTSPLSPDEVLAILEEAVRRKIDLSAEK